MAHRINYIHPQHPLHSQPVKPKEEVAHDFNDVLASVQQVKVSKHAKQRLLERNIAIDDEQWQLISEKMQEAKQKGVNDSLVILQDAALLVSTKNNTVITALHRDETASRIFTNINGTIVMDQ